ncbi:two-component system chemotaxis response regulator CheV [Marinobacter nauticus]|uniref:Two-component system chemotaxis response regulator CheV n=1 Tax=Marinobacter nauticus TaxID=2743 RepID=A0A368X329_MARNT|nr:chemotaxis protein [Marinobacter nauticus]RCW62129.1 two-component system chemotaxis response regulator CheV [Marinobacter nauticus]
MSGVLKSVDERTNLAGQNRLEMLLFQLGDEQVYGINVFKVREVILCPSLSQVPGGQNNVKGLAHLRGETVPIIDMAAAIGKPPFDGHAGLVIVTEYNRNIQGFLVHEVDRIVNLNWDEIQPPPESIGQDHFLTAVVQIDGKLIDIIDVEKIFAQVSDIESEVSRSLREKLEGVPLNNVTILAVDDSGVARNQVKRALESIGLQVELAKDGKQALEWLIAQSDQLGLSFHQKIPLVVSDIEMPVMDGYTLTSEIRNHPKLRDTHVILHSSLSGQFNETMVKKVGADHFIAKFHPDELTSLITQLLDE